MVPTHGSRGGEIVQGEIVLKVTMDKINGAANLRLRHTSVKCCSGTASVIARQRPQKHNRELDEGAVDQQAPARTIRMGCFVEQDVHHGC